MNTEGGLKDSSTHHCYMAAVPPFAMNTEGGLKGGSTTAIWQFTGKRTSLTCSQFTYIHTVTYS